jgi:hypothetical protein
MPIVYACICPTAPPTEDSRTSDALRRVADELSGYEPELALFIAPARSGATKVGVFASDNTISDAVATEAKADALPVEHLLRWTAGAPPLALAADVATLSIATCGLDPRQHFEFGRAAARAIEPLERRIAIVCAIELSKANAQFNDHCRRALASWDVKSLVNMDASFRRAAREHAVAQVSLLMGALGGYRLQPRELSYEAGQIVAAIDVLGTRRGVK